jgi:alpha-L-fucosidase 2
MDHEQPPDGPRGFVSRSMARRWDDGLVAGTGTIGAVLHGTPACHVLDVSHEEFFFTIMEDRAAPRLATALPEARRLLLDADADGAAALLDTCAVEDGFTNLIWTDPFVPAASVTVVPQLTGAATGYRRTGDFETGEVAVEWDVADAGSIRLSALPLRVHHVIVLKISATVPVAMTLTLQVTGERRAPIDAFAEIDSSARASAVAGIDGDALTLSVRPTGTRQTSTAHTRLTVVSGTAARRRDETSAQVDVDVTTGPAYAILTVETETVHATEAEQTVRHLLEQDRWEDLVREQRETHGELTARSRLTLSASAATGDVETLFEAARSRDAAALRALTELAYTAGRHTIISATGVLPPNLQGVWQGSWTPPWSSDYTMNGNLQTAVAACASTGTPELLLSVFRLLDRFLEHYRENARNIFGADGHLLPARVSTHGRANHFTHDYPHQFWIGNGGWMLRLAYDYFAVTGDRTFVEETAWPLAREVMRFYESILVADDRGLNHVVPCFSPENTPAGVATPLAVDATSEIAMLRDGIRVACRFADLTGNGPLASRWTALNQTLPQYRVAADGSLAEWLGAHHAEHPGHRHASHLYPLWYEPDPAFGIAERTAAAVTVAQKLAWRQAQPGPQQMAFGLVQLGLAAAHLEDAETSLRCVEWLVRDHWKPNMVSTHDEGAIFNVDACGGVPALIAEMLLQSTVGELRLLPALPAAWTSGRVTGLRGRGGVVVDELIWTPEYVGLSCRFKPGSEASRPDATLRILPPQPSVPGPMVQLSEDPAHFRFPRGQSPTPTARRCCQS